MGNIEPLCSCSEQNADLLPPNTLVTLKNFSYIPMLITVFFTDFWLPRLLANASCPGPLDPEIAPSACAPPAAQPLFIMWPVSVHWDPRSHPGTSPAGQHRCRNSTHLKYQG